MRSNTRQRRIRSDFSLGGEQAEADWLLNEAFYETGLFRGIQARDQKKCFLVGRTGSGKSACLQMLEAQNPAHVIRIAPEDLALPYITDLGVVRYLSDLDVHLDPLFIALWKHVLIIEIIKHRYKADSQAAIQRVMSSLKEVVKRDKSKRAALDYLEEFEGKFWVETDRRIHEIATNFERQISAEATAPTGVPDLSLGLSMSATKTQGERVELRQRYQKIVNSTQLPRLNKMVSVLNDDVLDAQHFTYIVIDDLDRDWADEKISNDVIRCLFRAVNDLKHVQSLKILVALRTNIFESLDFGRTGGQEEKFRSLIARVTWTRVDLKELLDARAVLAGTRHDVEGIAGVEDLLPRGNSTRGSGLDYIMTRTLMRPRDAIAFFNECFPLANNKDRLTWSAIKSAETSYSLNRLLALRDEWKPTFPGVEHVLQVFKGSNHTLSPAEMCTQLDNCALVAYEDNFPGAAWLKPLGNPIFAGSGSDDWAIVYLPLIRLLHNIGFIGCVLTHRDSDNHFEYDDPAIFNYDQPAFTDLSSNLRKVTGFVVHPAFRPALDIPG